MESDIPMGLEMVDATTSKLGADMTDEQIERLAQTHLTAGDDGEVFGVVKFARALLARQPAAIDKQKTPPFVMCLHDVVEMWNSTTADSFEDELMEFAVKAINFYKDTLPGSAALSVPERMPGEKFSEWAKRTYESQPVAPSVEQDERGADHD
jgi:hypothetical protein